MSDAEWAVVRDAIPVPGWLEGRGGQPESCCHRQMVDAVRYLVAGGIIWRAMPTDFPAWDRVYAPSSGAGGTRVDRRVPRPAA
ncbi:transposase [Streptomyces sp. NPDC017082]|uniref:transposase n=1 Tax=Streptomyces sp. NPDC017082 TaxID=3364974 RepID=UPI0037A09289